MPFPSLFVICGAPRVSALLPAGETTETNAFVLFISLFLSSASPPNPLLSRRRRRRRRTIIIVILPLRLLLCSCFILSLQLGYYLLYFFASSIKTIENPMLRLRL